MAINWLILFFLLELEVGTLTGAGYGEKDPSRRVQRNGYRDRD